MKFAFVIRHPYTGPTQLLLNGVLIQVGIEPDLIKLVDRLREAFANGVLVSVDVEGAY